MKKFKILLLLIVLLVILCLCVFFFKSRYIIGIVNDTNEFSETAMVTPIEMYPEKIISNSTFRIKTDVKLETGNIIKLHLKPTLKYFWNIIFNPSIIESYSLPTELEYSVEIIKK
ncbi:MAG: hypothetical protein K1W33_01610 [Clostridia bacterium]